MLRKYLISFLFITFCLIGCFQDPTDTDGDGIIDDKDNCINVPNQGQEDADNDWIGDACDNCPDTANFDQTDSDNNGIGDACEPDYCWGNDMCANNEYCYFAECALETGICQPRPEACITLYDPVCGCDGKTYSNACVAAANGMSVDYKGECKTEPENCWTNDMCGAGEYCYFAQCGLKSGVCQPKPEICITLYDPVCGCDGRTYSNSCVAAANGMSVDYKGECTDDPMELQCVLAGGTVQISSCCGSVGDFPNLCLDGPCGCAPEYSHDVKVCVCDDGKCFDGETCAPYTR